jgi:hypothetical protein
MLEQEAVGLQELLVRYDQLEKALIEVAVSATKALNSSTSTPTRKPPSSTNLRSRVRSSSLRAGVLCVCDQMCACACVVVSVVLRD